MLRRCLCHFSLASSNEFLFIISRLVQIASAGGTPVQRADVGVILSSSPTEGNGGNRNLGSKSSNVASVLKSSLLQSKGRLSTGNLGRRDSTDQNFEDITSSRSSYDLGQRVPQTDKNTKTAAKLESDYILRIGEVEKTCLDFVHTNFCTLDHVEGHTCPFDTSQHSLVLILASVLHSNRYHGYIP